MAATVFRLKQPRDQALSGSTDDNFIGLSFALHAGRDIRGFPKGELLTSFPTAHLADHDWSGVNANADL